MNAMTQSVNPNKATGLPERTTGRPVEDQGGRATHPREPRKAQAMRQVIDQSQTVGSSHAKQIQEAADGDLSEAVARGQLGRQNTGRSDEDSQSSFVSPKRVNLRAKPIEGPTFAYEGEGAARRTNDGNLQDHVSDVVSSAKEQSTLSDAVEGQEALVSDSIPLDASGVGTLSASLRFKSFVKICSKDTFVPQPSIVEDLMQMQMTVMARTLS